jgi:IS1 family transposase
MNRLSIARRAQIIAALVDGNSVRATCRIVGAAKGTVLSLVADIGAACLAYQYEQHVNLTCQRIQMDEIWSFVGAKEKNTTREKKAAESWGDVWTWVAICADTKLVPMWLVAPRHLESAEYFMRDLAGRVANRIQLTTDGMLLYEHAVARTFTPEGVDYARLRKIYGRPEGASVSGWSRYSPSACIGAERESVFGNPDPKHISTSYVERTNLTMRTSMRRFTRLTNGFSKKLENHGHAIALHFMAYNYVKPLSTLSKRAKGIHTTPAMAAGLTDRVWTCEDIARLLEEKSESVGAQVRAS